MNVKNKEVENLFKEINKEHVYVGNLKKCTRYDTNNMIEIEDSFGICTFGTIQQQSETYINNQILIEFCSNPKVYIPLKELKNVLTYIKIYQQINEHGISLNDIILSQHASYEGDIFVDYNSLKPYYKEKGKVKLKQLKKDVL